MRAVDENIIATGGRDGIVRLWDTRQAGGPVKELVGNGTAILSLGVNSSLGLLAAGTEKPEYKHEGGDVLIW